MEHQQDMLQQKQDEKIAKLKQLTEASYKKKEAEREMELIKKELAQYSENPNLNKELYAIVDNLHGKALMETDQIESIASLAEDSLESKELNLFKEHKNKALYGLMKIYDKHNDNPQQKRLTRGGFLYRKTVKKEKTPNNYLGAIVKSQNSYFKDIAFSEMQRRLEVLEVKTSLLSNKVDKVSSDVKELKAERNHTIINMYLSDKNITQKEISDVLGVPYRTVKRVIQDFRCSCTSANDSDSSKQQD